MTDQNTSAASPPRGRARTALLWTAQGALALIFVLAAVPKFLGDPSMVATFEAVGAGQWLRHVTAACELAGAIGLLVPRLAALAALGLIGVMAGATITNLMTQPPLAAVTLVLGALLGLVAWGRWSGLDDLRALIKR